jgi:hypothetical protein
MSFGTQLRFDANASDHERPTLDQTMNIITNADTDHFQD